MKYFRRISIMLTLMMIAIPAIICSCSDDIDEGRITDSKLKKIVCDGAWSQMVGYNLMGLTFDTDWSCQIVVAGFTAGVHENKGTYSISNGRITAKWNSAGTTTYFYDSALDKLYSESDGGPVYWTHENKN